MDTSQSQDTFHFAIPEQQKTENQENEMSVAEHCLFAKPEPGNKGTKIPRMSLNHRRFRRPKPEIPFEMFDSQCPYVFEAYKKDLVVIQHNSALKDYMNDVFSNGQNKVFETDDTYTGMIWNKPTTKMELLDLKKDGVKCVFLPIKLRRWPHAIPQSYIRTDSLKDDVMWNNKYLDGIVEKFRNKEIFGHLDLTCLRVGLRVMCSYGPALNQVIKIRDEMGFVLQFEAQRMRLCWHVANYTTPEACDVTLIVSISEKCLMTGLEIRKPQPRLPGQVVLSGVNFMWPFLHKADALRVVDFVKGEEQQVICMLWHKGALAAFRQSKIKHVNKNEAGEEISTNDICWLPLKWETDKIHELWEGIIPAQYNEEMVKTVKVVQTFFRSLNKAPPGQIAWIA